MSKNMTTTNLEKQIAQVQKLMQPDTYEQLSSQDKVRVRRMLQVMESTRKELRFINVPD